MVCDIAIGGVESAADGEFGLVEESVSCQFMETRKYIYTDICCSCDDVSNHVRSEQTEMHYNGPSSGGVLGRG